MKKILVVLLALMLALSAFGAVAEEVKEYDIRALIWKYDDTYGSSVRQAMQETVDEINEEGEVKISFTMYDAADDMAKQVEQATMLVGEKPDFIIINLAEVASGQQLVDRHREAFLHRCLVEVRRGAADLVFVLLVALPDGPLALFRRMPDL